MTLADDLVLNFNQSICSFSLQYFEDKLTRTPFATKEENLIGAPFSVVPGFDDNDYMVTLGVDDADFEINFYGYDEKDKQRRKKAGVEIVCPEASFPDFSDYPSTLCGECLLCVAL